MDVEGDALTWDGSMWSARSIEPGFSLDSVSCTSSSFCVAVDDGGNALTYR